MKGALIALSLLALDGCGVGTYRIPNVEPVVKPKPEDDLLSDISGGDDSSSSSAPSDEPAATPPPAEEEKPSGDKPAESSKDAPKETPKKK